MAKLVESSAGSVNQRAREKVSFQEGHTLTQKSLSRSSTNDDESATAGVSAGAGTRYIYHFCNRTKEDDEFLMVRKCMCFLSRYSLFCSALIGSFVKVRFQVVCVLIGTAAFVSARKQKVVSANLFDQRKLGDAKRRKRDSSVANQEVEMAKMEETVPLTEDMVDVV